MAIAATSAVVVVLYLREYRSTALAVLSAVERDARR
jgi:hypothetical protein